jgi:hypothetical protein
MKTSILLIPLLITVGCQTYVSSRDQSAIGRALDKLGPPALAQPQPAITINSKFASRCPYDGTIAISKSCLVMGSTTSGGTNIQTWVITYVCPRDGMTFSDQRIQLVPNLQSIRLPIIDQ